MYNLNNLLHSDKALKKHKTNTRLIYQSKKLPLVFIPPKAGYLSGFEPCRTHAKLINLIIYCITTIYYHHKFYFPEVATKRVPR